LILPSAAQIGEAHELNLPRTATASVNSSFFAARLHRAHFDIVLRKLILQLQAFSQRIHKTSMVRFHSSVDSDDIVLAMSRDSAFHGTPHSLIAAATLNDDRMCSSVPDALSLN
jgi:hypothetical protein